MADTPDLAPTPARRRTTRATPRTTNGTSTRSSRKKEQQLEDQIAQLQTDLRGIADTLSRMSGEKVTEARGKARTEARHLQAQAQHVIDDVQGQAGVMEDQLKETIREKPLTAVASAVGIGFLLALLSRR
jgi:ElaB/YqjD/DUF883 family membrane-anchored ribosome-binding protein